jgi:hypothetical protein
VGQKFFFQKLRIDGVQILETAQESHHVWVRGRDRRVFTGVERLHMQERFQERGEEINRECFTQE